MRTSTLIVVPVALLQSFWLPSIATAEPGWSVVATVGSSSMTDQSPTLSGAEAADGRADLALDTGFAAGLAVRYNYESPWSSEIGWEYRSNDALITDASGAQLPSGNYASNIFYLNARYDLPVRSGNWQWWVGGGLTVSQEIDLDSESDAGETSFSDGGSIGYQFMAGADRALSDRWYVSTEVRYSAQRDLTLSAEEGASGEVTSLNYAPLTLQLGIGYRF